MSRRTSTSLWFAAALLPGGWARGVRLQFADGTIASVAADQLPESDDERHAIGLPGLPNLHSHAFQHLMAGLAEAPGGGDRDDFWSWRTLMYRIAGQLTPGDIAAVAAMVYAEMLEAGFTRVGEFHYLHHQPSGDCYDDPAEMAAAIASAADDTGIALTLLPVFYAHAGFGGRPLLAEQRRFVSDLDSYATLLATSGAVIAGLPGGTLGIAPHSLRAVTPDQLDALVALAGGRPIHIHVAEQVAEVDACLAWSGQRPVAWLLDHAPVDARWCLIHATHADTAEIAAIAARGAVAGLCPITEANLGDGLFPAADFVARGGRFGIGTDSNVRIDAAEELRLLDYGQRLSGRARHRLATSGWSSGRSLVEAALTGGAQALDAPAAALAPGLPADVVALARDLDVADDRLLDRWVFATGRAAVDAVWRDGRRLVREGRHVARPAIERRFAAVRAQLIAS